MEHLTHLILKQDWKKLFAFLLIFWLGMNFFQALFTEIMKDEAYYALFGQKLAWGYFDHPPFIGLMTYISALFLKGNLSVRFLTVFMQFFTLVIIWKIIREKSPDSKKIMVFFIIALSMVMFQAYGFVTTPDVPLLFFTAFFLLAYRNFLKSESWLHSFFLALGMVGMIYSKYHAFLIIGFIVLSNLKLLIHPKFRIAVCLSMLLLVPHIYWQISMDFPSFKYHLSDRSRSFKWLFFFEYLPNQLVVFNPFTFGAVIYILIKHRARDTFERGLYFLTGGFLTFFWIMSFRGHVEPHWTVICSIPMIILLYHYSFIDKKLMCFVKKWILPSLIMVFFVRIVFMTDWLPERLDFYGKRDKSKAIESITGDLPVIFTGSYQNPSNYQFFTGRESCVLSSVDSRLTQFDIWQKELQYQGKPVFIFRQKEGKSKKYHINGYSFEGFPASDFQSVNRIKINYSISQKDVCAGDTLHIDFEMHNSTAHDILFHHTEFPVTCKAVYFLTAGIEEVAGNRHFQYYNCILEQPIEILRAQATISGSLKTVAPDFYAGDFQFALTLDNTICCAINSDFIKLTVNRYCE